MKAAIAATKGTSTPVADFLFQYDESGASRFHMPGHKGRLPQCMREKDPELEAVLGRDITEVHGADVLSAPTGILAKSEALTTKAFGSRHSFFCAGGSSQTIKAMLSLACTPLYGEPKHTHIAAGRNAHRSFLAAASLLPVDVSWIPSDAETATLTSCPISPDSLREYLVEKRAEENAVTHVYITSPDYLGNMADIAGLAKVCHSEGALLLVDNAHGAYLKFTPTDLHPLSLGADLVCNSAHKTLPALTGTAYLHVSKNAPSFSDATVREALSLWGSSSPSWLMLESLDLLNCYFEKDIYTDMADCCRAVDEIREKCREMEIPLYGEEPLRISFSVPGHGPELAGLFRANKMYAEYADPDFLVLMITPGNTAEDFKRLSDFLPEIKKIVQMETDTDKERARIHRAMALPTRGDCRLPERVYTLQEAVRRPFTVVPTSESEGRILARPASFCPPAVLPAIPGERIDKAIVECLMYYNISEVPVLL